MKKIMFIAAAIALLSATSFKATAAPPSSHEQTAVHDVGKFSVPATAYVNVDRSFVQADVFEQSILANSYEMVLARPFRYEKKKFVSFNSRYNRWLKLKYGIDRDKNQLAAAARYKPDIVTVEQLKEDIRLWQIWASKVKLSS